MNTDSALRWASALLFAASTLFAQPPAGGSAGAPPRGNFDPSALPKICKITGSVVNKKTGEPVDYATVAVFRAGEQKPISGAIANKQGMFVVDKLPPGRYRVRVTFLSFTTKFIDSVLVTPRAPEKNIGTVQLEPNITTYKDVEVTGEREAVQYAVDKKIYNVEKDLTTTGGTAVDVLQNVPSITVDVDRNISLRGSSNVTVLIDGRPSTLTLEQIPADNIERIEVITNPSAKYDPDGTAGIINILLKKNQQAGYNGTVAVNIGTRDKYTASANLNFRNEAINIFLNYTFQDQRFFLRGNSWQQNTLDTLFFVQQTNDGFRKNIGHIARGGFDYFLDDNNTITFALNYGNRTGTGDNFINYNFLNAQQTPRSSQTRDNISTNTGWNTEANLSYRRTFASPQQLFTADIRYSYGYAMETLAAAQTYSDGTPTAFQSTRNPVPTAILTVQTDYEHPLWQGAKLEAGAKTIIRRIDNDFYSESTKGQPVEYKPDANLSNHFIYDEQVYSIYGVLTGGIDALGYTAGLRAEQTFFVSNQLATAQRVPGSYFNLFPSLGLKYKLPEEQEIGLNYSRRINRPSADALNPFPSYTDPFNLQVGNPVLMPEYISSVEVSYLKFFGTTLTINPSLYYRFTDNVISRFREVNSDGVTVTTSRNFAQSNALGAELIAQYEPFKWWRINGTMNYFWNRINASNIQAGLTNESFGGNARILSNFRLPEDIDLQIAYNYFLPTVLAQGTLKPIQAFDVAVKKDFFDNKLTVTLRASDLFDTRQFGINTQGVGFVQDFTRKRESQIVFLGLSYRFSGGIEIEERRQQRKRERDEQNGGGDENTFN
jgi:outer membrane receptor protein involved in Fe transport